MSQTCDSTFGVNLAQTSHIVSLKTFSFKQFSQNEVMFLFYFEHILHMDRVFLFLTVDKLFTLS